MTTPSLRRPRRPGFRLLRRRRRGQSLVEFAFVLPLFIVLLMAVIEFGFVFNAVLSINFATRDASLVAAEAGKTLQADCMILDKIDSSIGAPSNIRNITQVVIYRARADGKGYPDGADPTNAIYKDVYYPAWGVVVPGASTTCTFPDGTSLTVPYGINSSKTYRESTRCDVLSGCNGGTDVDTVGVQVTYNYTYFTPLSSFISLVLPTTLTKSNAMRIEPTQW